MAGNDASPPEDEAFARQLFRPVFREIVRKASWPIFPKSLEQESDDIVSLALHRAYQKRALYQGVGEDALLPWVLVILRNLTRDILRARKRRPLPRRLAQEPEAAKALRDAVTPDDQLGDEIPSPPLAATAWAMTAGSLLQAVSSQDRDVLLLRLGHGLSVRETARSLSTPDKPVSEAAVKMRLQRAVKRITLLAEKLKLGAPGAPNLVGSQEEPPETGSEEE